MQMNAVCDAGMLSRKLRAVLSRPPEAIAIGSGLPDHTLAHRPGSHPHVVAANPPAGNPPAENPRCAVHGPSCRFAASNAACFGGSVAHPISRPDPDPPPAPAPAFP